ncbi:MAG: lactate utilization protein [Alphaproteobacteria bacterium]
MTDSKRDAIFSSIASGLSGDAATRTKAAQDGIADRTRHIRPSRVDLPREQLEQLFIDMVQKAAATVEKLADRTHIAEAVARFSQSHDLPSTLRVASDLEIEEQLAEHGLSTSTGKSQAQDQLSVTGALAGVAETGTLIMASSPDHPSSLNFLPDNHIVVLDRATILPCYEDAWDMIRSRDEAWPRTVNWITGPSRTADIEQTIQMGAHGPRRLHILLIG